MTEADIVRLKGIMDLRAQAQEALADLKKSPLDLVELSTWDDDGSSISSVRHVPKGYALKIFREIEEDCDRELRLARIEP